MSTKGRTRNPYRTPSPVLSCTREKAISQDRRKFKSCVHAGFSSLAWTNPPNTTPTTPPASSSQDSLPSLSITPCSIGSSVIQTPGTNALEEVLRRHLYCPEEVSPTSETYLTDAGNRKSSCWKLEPVLEVVVGNELELEIEQFLKRPKSSNKYTQDSPVQEESRESYPAVPECQVAQHIVRPSTPEHQIIQPYCAPADTGSWHSRSQFLARQRQSASSLMHYRSSSPSVFTLVTAIVVLQRCIKRRVSDRNSDSRLREVLRQSCVVSKEEVLALKGSKEPDIAAWLLGCKNSSSSSNTDNIRSFENDSTCDNFDENDRLGLTKDRTGYLAPCVTQASPQGFIELARKHLGHLPDNIVVPLLASLTALFKSKVYALTAVQPAENSTSASGSFDSARYGCAPESSKSISNSKKRAAGDGDGDGEPSDTDYEGRHKKRKLKGESNTKDRRKWACPFYQREPYRYCVETEFGDFRKCARSPGFDQVHRVKDHISQCHSPKYCVRCFALFEEDEDLETHRRSSPACDVKQRPSIELLTTKQKALLKPRDRKSKSHEERWNTIYRICFPQDQVPPSPYYVHYSQERHELQSEVLGIIEEETRSPSEIDVNRLLLRVNEAFNTRRSADRPATVIPRTPLIFTPSTSHDSNGSTEMSSQTQAREIYIASPSVKHCSERVVLATSSGNNAFPSSELLKPSSLPRPSNGNQVCSLDKSQLPNGTGDLPMLDFRDDIEPLDFDQNEFDIAQSYHCNHTTRQPDLNDFGGLFDNYEGLEIALEDEIWDDTPKIFD